MSGFIILQRQMTDWEWYTNANVMRLFVHCIFKANHKAKKWQGIVINRGQFITSSDHLAVELKLSRQQIRTALDKLKVTNEITIKTTARYSVITVSKYELYQDNNQVINQRITNKQPTDNQLITTTNNDNNDNNDNNVNKKTFLQFWDNYPKKLKKAEALKVWLKLKPDDVLRQKIKNSINYFKNSKDWTEHEGKFIPHAATWLNQKRWEDEINKSIISEVDWV